MEKVESPRYLLGCGWDSAGNAAWSNLNPFVIRPRILLCRRLDSYVLGFGSAGITPRRFPLPAEIQDPLEKYVSRICLT